MSLGSLTLHIQASVREDTSPEVFQRRSQKVIDPRKEKKGKGKQNCKEKPREKSSLDSLNSGSHVSACTRARTHTHTHTHTCTHLFPRHLTFPCPLSSSLEFSCSLADPCKGPDLFYYSVRTPEREAKETKPNLSFKVMLRGSLAFWSPRAVLSWVSMSLQAAGTIRNEQVGL